MPKTYDLVCFGEIIFDEYKSKRVLAGAPLNTASIAAKLGLSTALISAININDGFILDQLDKRKVGGYLQKNHYQTGRAIVTLDDKKIPSFQLDGESAYDYIQLTPELLSVVKGAKFFYFGTLAQRNSISRKTLQQLLDHTDATAIYDLNLRKDIPHWRAIVNASLPYADILKVNEEEYTTVKPQRKTVFVTKGPKGATLHFPGQEPLSVPAPAVKVVDTTGAGDAFTAAMITGIHKKQAMKDVLEYAVRIASKVATIEGAYPNIEL